MQHIDVELFIIVGLVAFIAGSIFGMLTAMHLMTRNHLLHQKAPPHRMVPARPRPHQARTQVLYPEYDEPY